MRGYRLWLVVILVVAAASIWASLPSTKKINILGSKRNLTVVKGLDLQGGSRVLLEAAPGTDVDDEVMSQAKQNVERRVNALGVSGAEVSLQGSDRISVSLPGVREQQVAFDAIKSTGLLEFVDFSALTGSIPEGSCVLTELQVEQAQARLAPGEALPPYDQWPCDKENEGDAEFAYTNGGQPYSTIMTGAGLSDAAAQPESQVGTTWVVNFKLKGEGDEPKVRDFLNYVANGANKPLAIVLDGRLVSYPTIQSGLAASAAAGTMDGGIITGGFTKDEADILTAQLKYGALPVPLNIIAFDTIGPSLGKISVDRSIRAGILGIATVITFMLIYYRIPGIAAALALLLFAGINFALFKFIPVELSLPAIIGFLISIGTAVDGNILIFERMKEELRDGRTLERAIEAGFNRAWNSIRDSNTSTIIICGILYFFGSAFGASTVRGFAVTLALGLVINLFTAVVATRTFLHTLVLIMGGPMRAYKWLLGV
ncbi:MAG TPA: protein translocase subunit SecD [Aggregatilineaceae bacterium]|nr:protein translocase subunit SecD [Aggregatilineaceae bacterium]